MHGHEQPWHNRKMKCHMALVTVAEVSNRILRPLIGFCQEHPAGEALIDSLSQVAQESECLRQVFADRAFPLIEIGDGIETETIHAHFQPAVHYLEDRLTDA